MAKCVKNNKKRKVVDYMIQKGIDAIKSAVENSNNGVPYLKFKANEAKVIRFLQPVEELISVYEHVEEFKIGWRTITCIRKENGCPLCKAAFNPIFHTYIPLIDKSDQNKVKIFKVGVKVGDQFMGLIKEYGDITKRDFKILKTGEKLKTQYHFFAKDPSPEDWSKVEIPDIEKLVQPKSISEIESILAGGVTAGNNDAYENSDDGFKPVGSNAPPNGGKSGYPF